MATEKKLAYNAYVVEDYKQNGEEKQFWTRVGTAFQHKDGEGFDVVLRQNLSVSGRIVLRVQKPDGADE